MALNFNNDYKFFYKQFKTNKMKKILSVISTLTVIAVFISTLSLTSCKKESQSLSSSNSSTLSEQQTAPLSVDLVHPTFNIEDADKMPPSGDATLLFDNVGHTPVLAPDGHQVTLGEFNMVSGYAEVKCINAGTHVVIHMKGLIPNGVYSIWVVVFKFPGSDPTFANIIAGGALGPADGSKNAFTASPAGTASLSAILPAGPLSEGGSVGNCLSSEYEVQLWGAYHIDGLTSGGSPGDESTWVAQFIIPFYGSQLQ
jgi:hypothetical protein